MSLDKERSGISIDRVVVATTNPGKVRELIDLFAGLPISVLGFDGFGELETPDESGATFEENARMKAADYARQIGEWVIADDSGLEIDFLDGAPGVHSARFGGEAARYAEKMRLVLDGLSEADGEARSATFVSVIAMANPAGEIVLTARGECRGTIAREPRGTNGFGYDPIFIPEGNDRTFGEMADDEKRVLSHRSRAAAELIRKMLDFTGL